MSNRPPPPSCSSDCEDDFIVERVSTELVPSKNASVEGRFDESKRRAVIYLDGEVIEKTRLKDHIKHPKAGYYYVDEVYPLLLHELRCLQDAKGKEASKEAGIFSLPSEDLLQACKKESAVALRREIAYHTKTEYKTSHVYSERKEAAAYAAIRLQTMLWTGEDCTVWKDTNSKERKCLGSGTLSFDDFSSFSLENKKKLRYFEFIRKDILSGRYSVEQTKAEEKVDWQVVP